MFNRGSVFGGLASVKGLPTRPPSAICIQVSYRIIGTLVISASDTCRTSVEDASLSLPLLVVKTTSDSWIHDFVDVPSGYGFRCFEWTTHFHPIGDFRQHVDNRVRASLLSWSSKTLPLGADRIGKPHGHPDMELRYGSLSCRPSVGSFSFVHAFRPRH